MNKEVKGFFSEFKKFISRGNVMDLAVGVIIGTAFGKIVTSIVEDILMPIVGMVIGGINLNELSYTIGTATIRYGLFIQNIIDFLIVSFCIFVFIKIINRIMHKKEQEKKLTKDQELLTEIIDLLKKQTKKEKR